jgi:hypothetical protein
LYSRDLSIIPESNEAGLGLESLSLVDQAVSGVKNGDSIQLEKGFPTLPTQDPSAAAATHLMTLVETKKPPSSEDPIETALQHALSDPVHNLGLLCTARSATLFCRSLEESKVQAKR